MSLKLSHATRGQLEANDVRSSTLTGTGIDIREFVADIVVMQHSDATNGADVTLDGKLQESDSLGSGYADITGATFTQVDNTAGGAFGAVTIKADATKRYIRYVGTIAGTTPSFAFGVTYEAFKKAR